VPPPRNTGRGILIVVESRASFFRAQATKAVIIRPISSNRSSHATLQPYPAKDPETKVCNTQRPLPHTHKAQGTTKACISRLTYYLQVIMSCMTIVTQLPCIVIRILSFSGTSASHRDTDERVSLVQETLKDLRHIGGSSLFDSVPKSLKSLRYPTNVLLATQTVSLWNAPKYSRHQDVRPLRAYATKAVRISKDTQQ